MSDDANKPEAETKDDAPAKAPEKAAEKTGPAASTVYKRIAMDGLWDNNVVFAQMLALCPLLAVTGTATNGLGMGLATTVVLIASNLAVSGLRQFIPSEVRIPAFVLIIAVLVTIVDMAMNAWVHDLYLVLGLFIPLIVTNCAILGRAESMAYRHGIVQSAFDGLMMGVGFTWALVILGAVREVIGSGTLFANASLLLGESFAFMELTIVPDYRGFLLAMLPPGGFLALGFLIAGKRVLSEWIVKRRAELAVEKSNGEATA